MDLLKEIERVIRATTSGYMNADDRQIVIDSVTMTLVRAGVFKIGKEILPDQVVNVYLDQIAFEDGGAYPKMIDCLKRVREATGFGLRESKMITDAWKENGRSLIKSNITLLEALTIRDRLREGGHVASIEAA